MKDYRSKLNKLLERYRYSSKAVSQEKKNLAKCKEELGATIEAQQIIQQIAAGVQASAHQQIASVVTKCLEAVFDDPYTFKIHFDQKRGKTEARLVFERDGIEINNPMKSLGGGVISVAAFALRLACLLLTKPQARKLLVLDEPFGQLSVEYMDRLAVMLQRLSEEMGFQMIIVTHNQNLQVGKVIRIT